MVPGAKYGNIKSSIVNIILYAIWYDMLNIDNNDAAKNGNI